MDPLSNLINSKASALFDSSFPNQNAVIQPVSVPITNDNQLNNEILNLENDDQNINHLTQNKTETNTMYTPNTAPLYVEPIIPPVVFTSSVAEEINQSNQNPDISKLKAMLHQMKDQIDTMLRFVNGESVNLPLKKISNTTAPETGEQIIEGVFTGEKMISPDGKDYAVPPNYASKSKLVEGDIMKLTITNSGRFIYKQISPIEKQRLIGELINDPSNDQWCALANGKTYKLLTASVTFYKGMPGDDVVFFIPKKRECSWGAVENIIHKHK